MDFFSQQEKAKRYTRILLFYFLIAVTFIVFAVNVIVYYFFIFLEFYPYTPENWFSGALIYYISIGTCLLMLGGSYRRWRQLKSGGHAIARMLGAELLDLHTSDIKKQRLINVVEEMSIASGVPLPTIFVLKNEAGVNAFVAGFLPTESVMVITQGAIEGLNREELQAVVAHEYSHILNGDMLINIRLMALLAGILMVSTIGRLLMHKEEVSVTRRNNGSALIVLGFLLHAIGYIGVLCGRMIKAAVSRQREYLADAASVQFTRNPHGLASALNKIREAVYGSTLKSVYAEDMSHMCFSRAVKQKFSGLLATHPPIENRIKCVDPAFFSRLKARRITEKNRRVQETGHAAPTGSDALNIASYIAPATAREYVASAGHIDQPHLDYAIKVHDSYDDALISAVHQTSTAKTIVILLLLKKTDFDTGMAFLNKYMGAESVASIHRYKTLVFKLKNHQRLPLFDMLLPALKRMTNEEKNKFLEQCKALIRVDGKQTLSEFVLLTLLDRHLSPQLGENIQVKYHSFKSVKNELQLIFSAMTHASGCAPDLCELTYERVASGFQLQAQTLMKMKKITPKLMTLALRKLAQLSPLLKRNVIEACADIAMDDGRLKSSEAELIRAVAESMDCPIPPLLPDLTH